MCLISEIHKSDPLPLKDGSCSGVEDIIIFVTKVYLTITFFYKLHYNSKNGACSADFFH